MSKIVQQSYTLSKTPPSRIPRFSVRTMERGAQQHEQQLQKPSRLEQMRAEYQRKLMREKEQKLIELYENNQRRALEKINRPQNGKGVVPEKKLLEEQQQKNWRNQHREYSSSTIASNRTLSSAGSDFSYVRSNMGRDRSKPLAPLDRRLSDTHSGHHPPVPTKPRIPRHRGSARSVVSTTSVKDYQSVVSMVSAPAVGSRRNFEQDLSSASSADSTPPPNLAQLRSIQRQRLNSQRNNNSDWESNNASDKKMTDFQRWQLEQDKAKAERLKRHRQQNGHDFSSGSDVEKENDSLATEIAQKQRELLEALQQREAELIKLQLERKHKEEEELMQEKERRIKQEAAERERRRRMQEEEAERERLRQQEAQDRQRHEAEELKRRLEEERKMQQSDRYSSADEWGGYSNRYSSRASTQPPNSYRKTTQKPVKRQTSPPEEVISDTADLDFFNQAAKQEGAIEDVGKLVACRVCGRKFATDRIARHQAACGNAQKKRKVLDPSKMRTTGTEMEKYANNPRKRSEPQRKTNNNWRAKREDFIKAIRYAKQVSKVQSEGGNLADLPPPPPSENPDYVQCPHCTRRFNPGTAERHIPKCKDIKARPAPVKRR